MPAQKYTTKIRMPHVDSAGVVFYANLFVLAHECYESWLEQFVCLSDLLEQGTHLPIVHAEADYQKPIRLWDEVTIEMKAEQIKQHSYTLEYQFKDAEGNQTASAKTVHVAIDSQTRKAIDIPAFLRDALLSL
ncbi:MAG: acyl-CoA thioesterase [Planctomycetota bacterium]|jgi:YbgC/YbaW family acyl-CoA thioester hydrolase